jgi:transcriptional regulator with XRE-family HTH domain
MTFTMLLGVGTGGDYTPSYHLLRSEKGAFNKPDNPQGRYRIAVADDIEHIRSILNLTMAELARCLGVSRQALYNWIAGGRIKDENLATLNELKFAANVIAAGNLPERALFVRRKLPGGKTLLEIIASGGRGADAAHALIEMADDEAKQRLTLAKLFAGRQPRRLLGHGTPSLTGDS